MMEVKVVNRSPWPLPEYATMGSSGMDIRANVEDALSIHPMQRILVPTGLFLELPNGFEAQIRPRSGMAIKKGITCLNTPGTIDADYRGEIKILLINLSRSVFTISSGDRIAQMIVSKHEQVNWVEVELLTETARGEGGYGHTGVKNEK